MEKPLANRVGHATILPSEVEEGLVEIVEFLRTEHPQFPVFKQLLIKRAQELVKNISPLQHFWAVLDN